MTLSRADKEFRHPGVSYLDYKQVEMDRVITGLLPRLRYNGSPSVLARSADLTVDDFVDTFLEHRELFVDFDRDTTHRWVETHLLDIVNRGKSGQAVAGLRPLHGFTYRFRNARRSRAYGADEQLYAMIYHAPGELGRHTLEYLREFFFAGVDSNTETPLRGRQIDVETQALINLSEIVRRDIADRAGEREGKFFHPPLYPEASQVLAEDIVELLYHKDFIPRSVLVDYLKILLAFHLALYHLQIAKLLPALVRGEHPRPDGGFFLDVTGIPDTATARLAERSAAVWFGRIPDLVRATFTIKKLNEWARDLASFKRLHKPANGWFTVRDLLPLLGPRFKAERERFADARLQLIVERSRSAGEELDSTISQINDLGLDRFTTYIEVITAIRVSFHRKYITECLDTLLLKNRPGAMIAQPRRGERRFILDARLLEVLLQIALLRRSGGAGLRTTALRVDEFLTVLRERYGLYIDRLPPGDGFERPTIGDHAALRENLQAFTARLREIGFYSDLSDAYLTQTITPRYVVTD